MKSSISGLRYQSVIFDLDGTLLDTRPGIVACTQHALRHFGLPEASEEQLRLFIGPPLHQSFVRALHMSEEMAAAAVTVYRQRYADKGIRECCPYPGIVRLLQQLRGAGARVGVCTAKAEIFAKQILHEQGIMPFVHLLRGYELSDTTERKPELLRLCIDELEAAPAVMVGDRIYDVAAAQACGIDAVGVSYGFGSADELSRAAFVAHDVDELARYLLEGTT